MPQLKFFAKEGHVVHEPGPKVVGQVPRYVGRVFKVQEDGEIAKKTRKSGHYHANPEGFSINSDHELSRIVEHYARQGGLWCADRATALHVGVPFVAVQFDAGRDEFVPVAESKNASANTEDDASEATGSSSDAERSESQPLTPSAG